LLLSSQPPSNHLSLFEVPGNFTVDPLLRNYLEQENPSKKKKKKKGKKGKKESFKTVDPRE